MGPANEYEKGASYGIYGATTIIFFCNLAKDIGCDERMVFVCFN